MEDTLRAAMLAANQLIFTVLILILMEDTLRDPYAEFTDVEEDES